MRKPAWVAPTALILTAFALSAAAFPHLPAHFPTHWNPSGAPDEFVDRVQLAFALPLVILGIGLILAIVPRYEWRLFVNQQQPEADSSSVSLEYDRTIAIVLAFLVVVHAYELAGGLGVVAGSRQPAVFAAALSLVVIVIGNYRPRITRRNAFIGIRLPWVFASEDVWRRTQRAGGYGMVAAGMMGLIGVVMVPSSPIRLLFAALVAQSLFVMVYSYRLAHSSDAD